VLPSGKTIISPVDEGNYFRAMEPNAFCLVDGMITALLFTGSGQPPPRDYTSQTPLGFFHMKTDGSIPADGFYSPALGDRHGTGPAWIASSPDKQWLYISGLGGRIRDEQKGNGFYYSVTERKDNAEHAVYRVKADFSGKMELFLGQRAAPGSDNQHFSYPE